MALSVKNMLGGSSSAFFPSVFATGVSQSDDVKLFKMGKGNPHGIPSEYQEVEYVGADSTQYINTGFKPKGNYGFEVVYSKTSSYGTPLGVRDASRTNLWGMDDQTENSNAISWYYGTQVQSSSNTIEKQSKRTVKLSHGKFYLNGTLAYTFTESTFSCSNNLYLFGMNEYGTSADTQFVGKIYEVKIFDNTDTLIHHYIPCYRKSDNVIGMYDLVSNTFYTNSGTGTFAKGDDCLAPVKEITNKKWVDNTRLPIAYTELEYIDQTDTNTYFDTGIVPSNYSTFEFTISSQRLLSRPYVFGDSPTQPRLAIQFDDTVPVINLYYTNTSNQNAYITIPFPNINDRYDITVKYDGTTISITDGINTNSATDYKPSTRTMKFGTAEINTGRTARFFYFKWVGNGNTIAEYIPCKNASGEVGVYDTVTSTFKKSTGTTFVGGAVANNNGYSFKLNELGMYGLSADNGSMTKAYYVLVDYPLEYVVPVRYGVWLYKNGDECANLTGGWKAGTSTASISKLTDKFNFSATNKYGTIVTTNKIDLTDYTKVYCKSNVVSKTGTPFIDYKITDNANGDSSMVTKGRRTCTSLGEEVTEIDVSAITGSHYISLQPNSTSTTSTAINVDFTEVWLE